MAKIIVVPNDIKDINNLNSDGFILGISNLNQYFGHGLFNELKDIIIDLKNKGKEVFVSMNKIMHNSDLKEVEDILIELDKINISGILFGDVGVINIWERLNLKVNLVWDQTHLVTNYHTCNYWLEKGVMIGNLSSELTLEEIKKIKENTDMKLMVQVFGFIPIFTSIRNLISNYFDYLGREKEENKYYIYDKDRNLNYRIREENGTSIYSGNILNGINEINILADYNIDYLIVNGFNIDSDTFRFTLGKYKDVNSGKEINVNDVYNEINAKLPFPTDRGFFYKQTIYKVREHE